MYIRIMYVICTNEEVCIIILYTYIVQYKLFTVGDFYENCSKSTKFISFCNCIIS